MNTEQFIALIAVPVVEGCKKRGWGVPSAIIGQAIQESMKSTGLSGLASTCNNYYGMKWTANCGCDFKEYRTKEQKKDGTYYDVVALFRKYPTVQAGIDGYFSFIEGYKRYKPVMAAKNYKEYALQLKNCGWATSINYTNNIISKVEKYNLTRFDSNYVASSYEIGKTYTLQSDLYIRLAPDGDKLEPKSLTTNAQMNAFTDAEGYAILRKGTRVTCKSVKNLANSTWIQIPSGWCAARVKDKIYIK